MNLPDMRHSIHAPSIYYVGRQYEAVDDHQQTQALVVSFGQE